MGVGHLSQPQSLHQSLHPCSPCGRFAPPSHRPCLLRCRSSVVEHSLGKGEVDSSILSGSTSGNADESGTFGDFGRERSAIEKSRIVQNDPATSAISDTLVAHWNTFRSATARRPAAPTAGRTGTRFECAFGSGSAHRASRGTVADERRIVIAGASPVDAHRRGHVRRRSSRAARFCARCAVEPGPRGPCCRG